MLIVGIIFLFLSLLSFLDAITTINPTARTGAYFITLVLLIIGVFLIRKSRSDNNEGKTKKCPFCAEMIKGEAVICRFCGKDVASVRPVEETVKCKSCGEFNIKGSLVCFKCGKKQYVE